VRDAGAGRGGYPPGGYRLVQYFQKTGMKINNLGGDPSSIWYVTSGHLVRELLRGQIQVGDDQWENRDRASNRPRPSDIQIAGDPNLIPETPIYDSAPVYTSLSGRLGADPARRGQQIDRRCTATAGSRPCRSGSRAALRRNSTVDRRSCPWARVGAGPGASWPACAGAAWPGHPRSAYGSRRARRGREARPSIQRAG
jgi:hypothetical protein